MTDDEQDLRLRQALKDEYADEHGSHPAWEGSPARLRLESRRTAGGSRLWQALAATLMLVVVGSVLVLTPRGPMAGDDPRASDAAAAPTSGPTSRSPSPTTTRATTTPSAEPSPTPSTSTTAPSASPEPSGTPGVPPIYGPEFGEDFPEAPPPVTVRAGDTTFGLRAWAYCYMDGCVDAAPEPGSDLPDVGDVSRVEIEFPLEGWTFDASFRAIGVACPRFHSVPLAKTGDHTFVLAPAGFADTYDVALSGRGNGSVAVSFRWTTPHDGPLPVPEARLAILSGDEEDVSSHGVELSLSGLRATPRSASAEVTVTAANGRSISFEAERETRASGCFSEGDVYWDGPDRVGFRAPRLGPAPFTYDVVVVLDGVRYVARAIWPADELEDQ
ncbi:MAG: hypothetical protein M3406_12755, partial [Chloroflexota bacterium]|nr:hypothetical protein [Chloroflexota bacterium]